MSELLKMERNMLNGKDIFISKRMGDTSFATHRHDYYEMIVYYNCCGTCILNGKSFPINDNALFFLTPQDYHRIEATESENSYSVKIAFSENIIDLELIRKMNITARVLKNTEPFIISCVQRLYNVFVSDDGSNEIHTKILLNEILYNTLAFGEKVSDENLFKNPFIYKSVMYMLTDVSAPISLESVASKFGISPCYYSELFHEQVGVPFKKWLIRVRIDRAKHLLEETDLPIISVALDSGFNNVSHFIRTFSSLTNSTPNEYRKSHARLDGKR